MTRAAWLLVVLCAAAAQAERARIAVHPLLADTVDDANIKQSIEDDIRNVVVSTRKLSPVGTDEVATALRAAKRCPAQREERRRAEAIETAAREQLLDAKASVEDIRREMATLDAVRRQVAAADSPEACDQAIRALTRWAREHGL
jgi:hypothetical protein